MFTLDVNVPEIKAAMFAQGFRVVADIDIWHWTCKCSMAENYAKPRACDRSKWLKCIKCVKHVNLGSNQRLPFLMTSM